jgi:hypothetical protein
MMVVAVAAVVVVVMIKKNRASCHDNSYLVEFFAEAILIFQYFEMDVPNYIRNLDMYKHI